MLQHVASCCSVLLRDAVAAPTCLTSSLCWILLNSETWQGTQWDGIAHMYWSVRKETYKIDLHVHKRPKYMKRDPPEWWNCAQVPKCALICRIIQCIAVRCSELQWVAVSCSVLHLRMRRLTHMMQCVAVCCTVLPCVLHIELTLHVPRCARNSCSCTSI